MRRSLLRGGDAPVAEAPPLSSGSPPEEVSEARREQLYAIYSAISLAMPTEGRDYRVEVDFGQGDRSSSPASIRLVPITQFGAEFCRQASEVLKASFQHWQKPIEPKENEHE